MKVSSKSVNTYPAVDSHASKVRNDRMVLSPGWTSKDV